MSEKRQPMREDHVGVASRLGGRVLAPAAGDAEVSGCRAESTPLPMNVE